MAVRKKLNQIENRSAIYYLRTIFAIVFFTVLFTGCAAKAVSEDDRNKDGSYDGRWLGTIKRTPNAVLIEQWKITCGNMAGELYVDVKNGEAKLDWNSLKHSTFVSEKGRFKFVVPYMEKLDNNPNNVGTLNHGINVILEGSLATRKLAGKLTMAYEDFANQGCTSKVVFEKSDK